ncbi:MAG: rRNA maturation RNase YbeY [Gammaproteobacteria bacterium]
MIDVQRATVSIEVPDDTTLAKICATTLAHCAAAGSVSVRVTDRDEMQSLNGQFRAKPVPTNVLSFPAGVAIEEGETLLGDIVLCAPVIEAEAVAQGKTASDHYAHMMVHGTLHLLGYDHIDDEDACVMEQCERDVLVQLGISDPYALCATTMPTAPDSQRTSFNG